MHYGLEMFNVDWIRENVANEISQQSVCLISVLSENFLMSLDEEEKTSERF